MGLGFLLTAGKGFPLSAVMRPRKRAFYRNMVAAGQRGRPPKVGEPCYRTSVVTVRIWLLHIPHTGPFDGSFSEHTLVFSAGRREP